MRAILILGAAALVIGVVACDDSAGPSSPSPSAYEGVFDPAEETFVLQRLNLGSSSTGPVLVDLIGRNLQVDWVHDLVSLEVALRNVSGQHLYPPAIVRLWDFDPSAVRVTNANYTPETWPEMVPEGWAFDYSWLLGPDDILGARGQSDWLTWYFYDPGSGAFRFAARASLELEPVTGVIAGVVFADTNQDGIRQPEEGSWNPGVIHLTEPSGEDRIGSIDLQGGFRFLVDEPGLHRLRLESLVDCIICFTTPNPVEVLLPPSASGPPQSYWSVEFGVICGPCLD